MAETKLASALKRNELNRASDLFAALSDQNRLRLLTYLSGSGPLSTARLTSGTSITRQAVTKHLSVLSDAGLVRNSRIGRERVWEFNSQPFEEIRVSLGAIERSSNGKRAARGEKKKSNGRRRS